MYLVEMLHRGTLSSLIRFAEKKSSCTAADRATDSPIRPCKTERSGRESERNREKRIRRKREKERPIVRSMREEIGDSISTQMSRGQIFPGSGP